MQYKEVFIRIENEEQAALLTALLSGIGFEGFEEKENQLLAYIPATEFDEAVLTDLFASQNIAFATADVAEQNWNAVWEGNFQPVVVPGFCTVRAHFHDIKVTTPHDIVITPQMSFGTGHHATTMLMMMQMQHLHFAGARVLDFGTGTGILAILAEKLGAAEVVAIDNDQWAYDNTLENIGRNKCYVMRPVLGSLEAMKNEQFDIILANINRNILLHYMADLYDALGENGQILMSGLLAEDMEVVKNGAVNVGFKPVRHETMNNWIVLLFKK